MTFIAMRDWLTKDLSWIIVSLLLAVAIWLTVYKIREEPEATMTQGVENTYGNLPVHLLSAAQDVRDYRVAPDTVIVTVSGPPKAMAVLQADQIHAMVNLTGIESSRDSRRSVEVSVPVGMTLVRVEPPEVGVIVPPPTARNKP
jgi:YbbR domain-containing protein